MTKNLPFQFYLKCIRHNKSVECRDMNMFSQDRYLPLACLHNNPLFPISLVLSDASSMPEDFMALVYPFFKICQSQKNWILNRLIASFYPENLILFLPLHLFTPSPLIFPLRDSRFFNSCFFLSPGVHEFLSS